MWLRSPTLWLSLNFWIYVNSGILAHLDNILKSTLIFVPIYLELDSSILQSHIPVIDHECELQHFDLNSTLEPCPILESKLNLNQFYESVLVPESFTLEFKSTTPPNHILLLDQGVEQYNLRWFTKIGHITGMIFMLGSWMIIFKLRVITIIMGWGQRWVPSSTTFISLDSNTCTNQTISGTTTLR